MTYILKQTGNVKLIKLQNIMKSYNEFKNMNIKDSLA